MKKILLTFALIFIGNIYSQNIEFDGYTMKYNEIEVKEGDSFKILDKADKKYSNVLYGQTRIAAMKAKTKHYRNTPQYIDKISEKKGKIEFRGRPTGGAAIINYTWVKDVEKALEEGEIELIPNN